MMNRIIAIFILAFFMVVSSLVGVANLHLEELLHLNFQSIDWQVIYYSRIPRSLSIVLTGATLAIAGMILQILFSNRFVEPSMVGTTQGVALGLLFMTVYFPASYLIVKMTVSAMCGLIATLLFLKLIQSFVKTNALLIPLIGIIYSGILLSISTFFAVELNLLQVLDAWLNGEFSSVLLGRYELLWIALITAIVAYILADRLTIAGLGETMATNLGLNYQQVMKIGLIIVTIVVATVIVTVGNIPFLGLIVPNVISRLFGDNLRKSVPWVAYLGALLLLICDIVARIVYYPFEISVSLIMGMVGTVMFLYLLFARRANNA